MKKLIVSFLLLLGSMTAKSQAIVVENVLTPEELVEDVLVGTGVVIMNVEFNYSVPLATSVQAMAGYFDADGTTFPIDEGVILATGNCALAVGPNDAGGATDNDGVATDPNDPDLNAISTAVVNNEAVLEFDFIPDGDSVVFNYIFASEEYPEYVGSTYNDVFGFFISGPGFAGPYTAGAENIALIPGTTTPVAINNVNNGTADAGPCENCEYYVSNAGGTAVQYDGHTTVLQAAASVECGETYHIKIAIGDAGDMAWDSAVFLEASSFSSNGISVEVTSAIGDDAIIEGCDSALVEFIRPEEADTVAITVEYEIGGTAIGGTDYDALDGSVDMGIGVDTVSFYIAPYLDALDEGTETITISVSFLNECGDTVTTTATIEVIDPMPYEIISTDTTITCPQDSVLIAVTTDGGIDPIEMTWTPGGGSGSELWVPGLTAGTTTYTIDATDACGVDATGTIEVTIDPAPTPSIVFNEDEFTICPAAGADITSTVIDPYSTPVTYEWDPTGETTADITASPTSDSWYYLTIEDGCFTITDSVEILIGGVDIDDITVVDATDCPGAPSPTLGSITVSPDFPTWTYELVGFVGPQPSGVFNDLAGGINYILSVTDENGCTSDTVVFVPLGANEVEADFILDSLRNVSCFDAADGGAFVTNITGGLMPPFDVDWNTTTGTYSSDTGIPDGGSSDIDNLTGGLWTVVVTDQFGCSWSETFEIEEPDEMDFHFTWNEPNCFGFTDGSVTANVTGGNGDYTYTITDTVPDVLNVSNSNTANNLGTGWYYATVVDAKGCEVSGAVFLDQPDPITADLDINQPQCYGIPTGWVEVDSVYGYQGDYDNISYFWEPNPGGVGGIGATFNNKMGPGDYTITINDSLCSTTIDYTIEYPPQLIFTEIGYEPAYCRLYSYQSGNGKVFAAAGGGTPDYTYTWVNQETGAETENTTWGGLNPGSYQITVTDNNGCVLTQQIVLDSLIPHADFTVTSAQLDGNLAGTAVVCAEFVNTSTDFALLEDPLADTSGWWHLNTPQDPTSEPWTYYEGTEGFNQVLDTCYEHGGEYDVCLIVQNHNGCVDTTCKTITVYDPLIFKPVNIFTPDGDGVNDIFTFEFLSQAVKEINVVIVNRWGVKMAELNHITEGWDGTDQSGSQCRDGVYFYIYEGEAENGDPFSGQGTIQLIGTK
ncbi:MAG: choice-of-anchor L domain-containing protein [Flavobacteriales bacterium]|nr:choice-of-anchor L domain-containing protein [Flavobacteriales bacterium]